MEALRLGTFIIALSFAAIATGAEVEVFHNGGTGNCQGCHTSPPQLLGSDSGSTCLICHQAPVGVTLPAKHYVATDVRSHPICIQLPPGGDFCWLKKNYKWSQNSTQKASPGERHGHNIIAQDYGFEPNDSVQYAPGGTYPSSNLTCISCHDPHGNYRRLADGTISSSGLPIIASGSYTNSPDPNSTAAVGTYRRLAGIGYRPKSMPGAPVFTANPPAVVAPPFYNRAETISDTRVAYGSGISEWCRNCHPQMIGSHQHPAGNDALLSLDVMKNYNAYISSGDLSGRGETSYTSMVPFELRTNDYSLLKGVANTDSTYRAGPTGNANVMCLTCHRAHASGWDSISRWNMSAPFIVYNGMFPGIDNGAPAEYAEGRLSLETRKTFYDRPATNYAPYQRSLCNKCHRRD